jgi:hypothetical protein
MYPPKKTEDPQEWIRGLWESLSRAGDHFHDEAIFQEQEHGYAVFIGIRGGTSLPPGAAEFVKKYVKHYAQACGWKVAKLVLSRAGLRMEFTELPGRRG